MNQNFKSDILIIPGLGDSGEEHWQTLWQKEFGFRRVHQRDWETPVCDEWVDTLQKYIDKLASDIILVGHSLACCTIINWFTKYRLTVRGALLVAPSDTESEKYPAGTTGFAPMPLQLLSFPSIVVASNNDPYVSLARAEYFASQWGSALVNIGSAGHINVAAGFGPWPEGLHLLKKLDTPTEIS